MKAKVFPRRGPEMNKVEASLALIFTAQQQAGEIIDWGFERINLRLADHTYFKIDFYVVGKDRGLTFVECKAAWKDKKTGTYKPHWEDDARVKIKVAAQQFPCFRFVGMSRSPNGWIREEF